jgi:hypothetical protein
MSRSAPRPRGLCSASGRLTANLVPRRAPCQTAIASFYAAQDEPDEPAAAAPIASAPSSGPPLAAASTPASAASVPSSGPRTLAGGPAEPLPEGWGGRSAGGTGARVGRVGQWGSAGGSGCAPDPSRVPLGRSLRPADATSLALQRFDASVDRLGATHRHARFAWRRQLIAPADGRRQLGAHAAHPEALAISPTDALHSNCRTTTSPISTPVASAGASLPLARENPFSCRC